MPAFEIDSPVMEDLLTEEPAEVNVADSASDGADVSVGEELMSNEDQSNDSEQHEDVDYMTSFLNEFGVKDGIVTYENEDGTTEEVNFNDLDSNEKLNILRELTNPGLSQDEINTINYLRTNNASLQDVINYYSQVAVQNYISSSTKEYAIDDYTDDELYIASLKEKFPDMSESDLEADLENAKSNEELYKRKVDTIRNQYKALEEEQAKAAVKEREEQYNTFRNSVHEALNNFKDVSMDYKDEKSARIQVEDSERERIYDYILRQDQNGESQMYKDLNDTNKLARLAWFALYGDEMFSTISNYWKSQLKSTRKEERKAQTTIVPRKDDKKPDINSNHFRSVETPFGDHLL